MHNDFSKNVDVDDDLMMYTHWQFTVAFTLSKQLNC